MIEPGPERKPVFPTAESAFEDFMAKLDNHRECHLTIVEHYG